MCCSPPAAVARASHGVLCSVVIASHGELSVVVIICHRGHGVLKLWLGHAMVCCGFKGDVQSCLRFQNWTNMISPMHLAMC